MSSQRQAPPAPQATPQIAVDGQTASNPQSVYDAAVARRSEITAQIAALGARRNALSSRLAKRLAPADRTVLEQRLTEVDKQLDELNGQLATANASVVQAAGTPGVLIPPRPFMRNGPSTDDLAIFLGIIFTVAVMMPLAIGFSRRMWRKSSAAASALPHNIEERLSRIESAVESVAIEVERVGEGQRFVTNLLIENGPHAIGAGPMEPVDVKERERVRID